jgi:hypothetical protein
VAAVFGNYHDAVDALAAFAVSLPALPLAVMFARRDRKIGAMLN